MVGGVGFEPTHPKGPDLQSGAALQLDRPPKYINALSKYMSNLSFDYLPVCARPGWNPDRLDTSRRILKTGPVQAPGPWKLDTSREDFRYSFEQQTPCGVVSRLGLEPRNLAVPDFKSVLQFAVRGFYQDTIIQIGPVRLPVSPTAHI